MSLTTAWCPTSPLWTRWCNLIITNWKLQWLGLNGCDRCYRVSLIDQRVAWGPLVLLCRIRIEDVLLYLKYKEEYKDIQGFKDWWCSTISPSQIWMQKWLLKFCCLWQLWCATLFPLTLTNQYELKITCGWSRQLGSTHKLIKYEMFPI